MKVLQLGKFYPILGGVEKVMYDLLTGLPDVGIECDMLCAHGEKGYKEIVVDGGGRLMCTRTWLKKYATMISPQLILKLRKIARNYDIVHVHHPDPMAALALLLSGYKGKVVLHWHSDILKQKLLLKLYRPLQQWLINRADLIVGTTPVYISKSPCLKNVQQKCTYLPIGIDPIGSANERAAEIRREYEGKKIVFSLGRLVHYKGYRYLVDAANYFSDDYVVLIGGSGALRDELQAQIDRDGLGNKVKLLGRIDGDDLAAYYNACDIYCLSSVQKTEAFAIVQIEAMSCGKPVVCCKIKGSGVAWVNADGESGLVVEPGDSDALAGAIQRILEDPELYEKLSKGAHDRFNTIFRRDQMLKRCKEIYDEIVKL